MTTMQLGSMMNGLVSTEWGACLEAAPADSGTHVYVIVVTADNGQFPLYVGRLQTPIHNGPGNEAQFTPALRSLLERTRVTICWNASLDVRALIDTNQVRFPGGRHLALNSFWFARELATMAKLEHRVEAAKQGTAQ
jgi:hypothetical protein